MNKIVFCGVRLMQLCRSLIGWLLLEPNGSEYDANVCVCIDRINYLCKKIESLVMIHDYFMKPSSFFHCVCVYFSFDIYNISIISIDSGRWFGWHSCEIWAFCLVLLRWHASMCVHGALYIIKVIWPYFFFYQINRLFKSYTKRISYFC